MAESTHPVPVLRCVFTAFAFLRRNLLWLYGVGSLYILINIASFWLSRFFAPGSAPFSFGALLSLLIIPVMVVLFAAYLRRALGMGGPGLAGVRLGADEWRLLVTLIAISGIIAFIVFIAFMFSMFAITALVASTVDPAIIETEPASAFARSGLVGQAAAVLASVGLGALLLYAQARFAPAFAAVIAQKRIVIFEAAAWSKGQGWRMVLATLLVSAPFYLISAPGMVQYVHLVLTHMPADGTLQSAMDARLDLRPLFWFFILMAFIWPANIGAISRLYAFFYQGLHPDQGVQE